MAITIHIKFEYFESVTGKPVTWVFRNRDETVVAKGTTNVGDDNLLIIPNIELGDKETLKLIYVILGKARSLSVQHNSDTREGKPLTKTQTINGKTVIISFMGYNSEVDKSLKNKPIKWSYKINPNGDLKSEITDTDEFGKLTIKGVEVEGADDSTEPEIKSLSQEISYEIEGIEGPFRKIEDKFSVSNALQNLAELKVEKYLTTRVEIAHIGGKVEEGTPIDWKLHKAGNQKPPPPRAAKTLSSLTSEPVVKPSPQSDKVELGEEIASGQTLIKDRKLIFPLFKISNQIPTLVYKIDGKEQNIKLKVDNAGLISETVFLENSTIHIDFKGNKIPTANQKVKWTLQNAKNIDVKMQDEKSSATDDTGRLIIDDVKFLVQDTLTFKYLIAGESRSIEIKHNADSEAGKPLRIIELLEGTTIEITFVSDDGTANKPLKWSLKNSLGNEVETEIPKSQATDESGRVIIRNVNIPGKQSADVGYYIFEYSVLGKEGKINVKHNDETREGKPLLITRHLDKTPIYIDFIEAAKVDSKGKNLPVKNETVEWKLKNEAKTELATLLPKPTQTDDKGRLTFFKGIEITDAKLIFEYQIRGQQGSVVIEDGKDGGAIIRTVPVGTSVSIKNPERLWLTYETRINWTPYSKTNQKISLNLFRMDINKVLLILDPKIDEAELEALRQVFFPKLDGKRLREFGTPPWDGERKKFNVTPKSDVANREKNILYIGYAVLPYNSRDNSANSKAIGTEIKSNHKVEDEEKEGKEKKDEEPEVKCCKEDHESELTPLKAKLEMWNTASRSSIVRVKEAEADFEIKIEKSNKQKMWFDYGDLSATRFLIPSQDGGTEFKGDLKNIFSIKSGVNLIGFAEQSGKAKLEHNSILAALRSAYIRDVESKFGYNTYDDPNILILTEIMTVTEVSPHWDDWIACKKENTADIVPQPKFGDGYQIRSLKGMKSAPVEYFPPICIPFVSVKDGKVDKGSETKVNYKVEGKILREWTDEGMPMSESVFAQIDDLKWQKFWEKHYVQALGTTKARLLLDYGLQGFGGNAQNFLLEMNDGVPNGRVVVRDMGDYALHDFVMWALFKKDPANVPDPRNQGPGMQEDSVKKWQAAFTKEKHPLLDFECRVLHEYHHDWKSLENPGVQSEFPTFTGYHRWQKSGMHTRNPFCKCCDTSDAPFVGHISPLWAYALPISPQIIDRLLTDVSAAKWAKIFEVETKWAIAHAKAWLNYMEAALEYNFAIDFESKPAAELKKIKSDWFKSPTKGENYYIHNPADYHTYAGELIREGKEIYSKGGQEKGYKERFLEIKALWTELYDNMKLWEMYLGWQIENFLQTEAGQMAIQKYHGRGRAFGKSKFRIQILTGNERVDKPIEEAPIKIKNTKTLKEWTDITDSNGEIHIYQGAPEDYSFRVLGYHDPISKWDRNVSELIKKSLHFNTFQVFYRG